MPRSERAIAAPTRARVAAARLDCDGSAKGQGARVAADARLVADGRVAAAGARGRARPTSGGSDASAANPSRFTTTDERWDAVRRRDASATGAFVYAVKTTGVVCRPACASRAPRRENVVFFDSVGAAERAGFRPCRRCGAGRPETTGDDPIARACGLLATDEDGVRAAAVAAAVGMTPASLARAFRRTLGVTPRQYRQRVLA